MKALVVGATAGLGRALAANLAQAGHEIALVARDIRDLDAVAADLTLRYSGKVCCRAEDIARPDASALRDWTVAALGGIDAVFLVAGLGDDDDTGTLPDQAVERLLSVNLEGPLRIVNAFFADLDRPATAHLVAVGSVATVRGRSKNMVYGAAKRGLQFYFDALRHRLAGSGCRVQFYLAGFMDTTMLGHAKPGLLVADPEAMARKMVANLDGRAGVYYLPAWWRLIALVLQTMPWRLFVRMKF